MKCAYVGGVFLAIGIAAGVEAAAVDDTDAVELAPRTVTASPFVKEVEELVVPTASISGGELRRDAQGTLGDTLDGQPGVHSSYFGPGAGRPVIRGFDGDRVRILNQGTDSFDVSQTSPDHGVSIEPLFANQIEIVRGPASLLYGNAAIGGVVNVIGKELPRESVSEAVTGEIEASYGTVANEKSGGVALQGGLGRITWSLGYLERSSGDLDIPGYAESAYQRAAEEAEEAEEGHEDEEEHEEEEAFGVLDNSFVDSRSGYLGMTWFGDSGSLGFSYSKFETEYGVPGHSHEHHHEDEVETEEEEEHNEHSEEVSIDLDQSRYNLRGELLNPIEFFESVEVNFGYGTYVHREIEGDEIGTVFEREGYEFRMTGVHRPIGLLTGAVGLQIKDDSFSAEGEEAFIPTNDETQYGLFAVERIDRDWGAWEFGGRVESVTIDPADSVLDRRDFTTVNGSFGFVRRLNELSSVSMNLSYAERAPNTSELYAYGPHVGTRSFEIGNAELDKESAINLDASYRLVAGPVTGELSFFYSDFSDYVYMQYQDEESVAALYSNVDTDGLDIYQATAVDARFYGFELDLRYHIIDEADRALHVDLLADQTRATNDTAGTNLPRIPTRRYGTRVEYVSGPWTFGLEGKYNEKAKHLAPNEMPTDGYFLWGMDAKCLIQNTERISTELFLIGRNLGDEEARPHTSFLKDLVPMPGRDVKVGIRTFF